MKKNPLHKSAFLICGSYRPVVALAGVSSGAARHGDPSDEHRVIAAEV